MLYYQIQAQHDDAEFGLDEIYRTPEDAADPFRKELELAEWLRLRGLLSRAIVELVQFDGKTRVTAKAILGAKGNWVGNDEAKRMLSGKWTGMEKKCGN